MKTTIITKKLSRDNGSKKPEKQHRFASLNSARKPSHEEYLTQLIKHHIGAGFY